MPCYQLKWCAQQISSLAFSDCLVLEEELPRASSKELAGAFQGYEQASTCTM